MAPCVTLRPISRSYKSDKHEPTRTRKHLSLKNLLIKSGSQPWRPTSPLADHEVCRTSMSYRRPFPGQRILTQLVCGEQKHREYSFPIWLVDQSYYNYETSNLRIESYSAIIIISGIFFCHGNSTWLDKPLISH